MTPPQTIPDRLRQAFAPTRDGVGGLAEQLLGACAGGGDAEFERVGDRCVYRWTVGGDTHEATAPLRPAAFRTILARVAALCNERSPDSVTPYGGEVLLTVKDHPLTVLRVAFVNTPEKQQLRLKSLGVDVLDAVEKKPQAESPHVEACRPEF